jgi:oxalate decarboxylase
MHWHPHADEWQYWIKGEGRMTVFNAGPRVEAMDFRPAGAVRQPPRRLE